MRQAQSVTGPDCLFVNLFYIYGEGRGAPKSMFIKSVTGLDCLFINVFYIYGKRRGAPKSMFSLGEKKASFSDK